MSASVVPCPDAFALQQAFQDAIARAVAERTDPFQPIVVVAPTGRLLQRLQVVAARRLQAISAVHFLTYDGLAAFVSSRAGPAPPRVLSSLGFEAVVETAAREEGGVIGEAVERYESAASVLAESVRDLREAGLLGPTPRSVLSNTGIGSVLARVNARIQERGRADHAALLREATEAARRAAPGIAALIHAGAYDVVAVARDLLAVLARHAPVDHLVLGSGAPGRAFEWAETRRVRIEGTVAPAGPGPGGILRDRLHGLFDPGDGGAFPPLPSVRWLHAPSAEAELEAAASIALAWHSEGIALEEIAMLARSLRPYEAVLRPVMRRCRLPFASSARLPLLRHARVKELLRLIDARAFDAPARSQASWADWVLALRKTAERVFDASAEGEPALQAVMRAIADLADLDAAACPTREDVARWACSAIERAEEGVSGRDEGGVRVLDMMQSRGLPFRGVILLGLHEGLLPRAPGPDPFLSDSLRSRLAADGMDVLPKGDNEPEERLLLALALGSAGERLALSWQHADERQRPRNESPYTREIARIAGVSSSTAYAVPAHPGMAARSIASLTGLCETGGALIASALLSPSDPLGSLERAARDLGVDLAPIAPGLRHLRAVEAFDLRGDEASALVYDGWARGSAPAPSILSVSALGRLAGCPLQYMFRDVMGVRELPRREEGLIGAGEIGSLVHRILERLYRDLRIAPMPSLAEVEAELAGIVSREVRSGVEGLPDPVARALGRAIEDGLREFLRADLEDLSRRRIAEVQVEKSFREPVALGGESIEIEGRIDRLARGEDRSEEVGDYKTGRRRPSSSKTGEPLSGRSLQLLLYALARHAATGRYPGVATLWVHPAPPWGEAGHQRDPVAAGDLPAAREVLDRKLPTLLGLARDGMFPLARFKRLSEAPCQFCEYRPACRVGHPPTMARVKSAEAFAGYYGLWEEERT